MSTIARYARRNTTDCGMKKTERQKSNGCTGAIKKIKKQLTNACDGGVKKKTPSNPVAFIKL
jgi:hypothetical protein